MSMNKNIFNIALEITENLSDEILFKTTKNFLDDTIKSIPFASLFTSSIDTYCNFKILKEQKQLLAFIQEAEHLDKGFIEKFFQDKDNTEIGLEILGILDQTYLEHQARMIGRATLLLKNENLSKIDFNKYTHIITRLNSHLIHTIEDLYNTEISKKNDPEALENNLRITNANMDLISFGFLYSETIFDAFDQPIMNSANYIVSKYFYSFYELIFAD